MDIETYKRIKNENKKKIPYKDFILSFIGGGTLGIIFQGVEDFSSYYLSLNEDEGATFASITIVFFSALLTFFNKYKYLGQIFGAGLFVPTTGFSNTMVASCMEGKDEGLIKGVGKNCLSLCGSVICFGIATSVIVCLCYYLISLIEGNLC